MAGIIDMIKLGLIQVTIIFRIACILKNITLCLKSI